MEKTPNHNISQIATNTTTDTKDVKESIPGTFLSKATSSPLRIGGFYDYGRGKWTLHVDHVLYNLSIAPDGTLTGSSEDIAGSATINGQIDFKNHSVNFTKQYGISNYWLKWTYSGVLSEDGRRIWGRWGGWGQLLGSGFWGMWLGEEDEAEEEEERDGLVGRERISFEMMAWVAEELAKEECLSTGEA